MFLVAIAAAVIVGLIRGGKLSNIIKVEIVRPWLIFLSVLLEASLIILMKSSAVVTQPYVFISISVQYLLLFLFVWYNRHLPYFWVIGFGSFLNALVILLNGGSMPIADIEPYIRQSAPVSQYVQNLLDGKLLIYHIINENTKLWFLGDIIWLSGPFSAFASIGDLFLYGGVFLLLQQLITGKTSAKSNANFKKDTCVKS